MASLKKQIIFFDGVCNLCNGFVDFVISRDPEGHFVFAPLQGKIAQEKLPASYINKMNSVVLYHEGKVETKSDAALSVLESLQGPWFLMGIFWIMPRFLRNFFYDIIASNRYRIFGKRDTCRLPTPEERARFLE